MFGGSESVSLSSGATLRCGCGTTLWVELAASAGPQRVDLPFPSAGYGGGELVVSPDQRHAALFVFSGQSEVGYELFALTPQLRHLGGLPYVHGEGDAPVFSPDGTWLAMVIACFPIVRGTETYAEDALDPDAEGTVLVDWAAIYTQRLPDGPIERVDIGTTISRSTDPDDLGEWELHGVVSFAAHGTLMIELPWGEALEVELPVLEPITTRSAP